MAQAVPGEISKLSSMYGSGSIPVEYQSVNTEEVSGTKFSPFSVMLIDGNKFSRECIIDTLINKSPITLMVSHANVSEAIGDLPHYSGIILYHSHSEDIISQQDVRNISILRAAYRDVKLIILSGAAKIDQIRMTQKALEAGAIGVVPTQITGIAMSIAVINLVQAGGTFVPSQVFGTMGQGNPFKKDLSGGKQKNLTNRELAILSMLDRGTVNKRIAHELGLSEGTVKVHVRNIMRKLNATNRFQAAYKGRDLLSAPLTP